MNYPSNSFQVSATDLSNHPGQYPLYHRRSLATKCVRISKWIACIILVFCANIFVSAQTPGTKRSTFSAGGSTTRVTLQGHSFLTQQSIGQGSVIGTSYKDGYVLRQGFIQPEEPGRHAAGKSKLSVTVYPNPFSEKITIELKEDPNEPLSIVLTDILGKTVYSQTTSDAPTIFLNPGSIPAGVYLLRMNTTKKHHVSKLIKN